MVESSMADQRQLCELLPWDSDFFGFRIARICAPSLTLASAAAIDVWCARHEVACLYFLAQADDTASTSCAEDHGFHLVDIRLTLARKLPVLSAPSSDGPNWFRAARPDDIPRLQEIARSAHDRTRFFQDAGFPRLRSRELYALWIEKCCTGGAGAVFVAEIDSLAVGYVACSVDAAARQGSIGLLGVSPDHRCEGIGSGLLKCALNWLVLQGAEEAAVVTQGGNCAAQRLYQAAGFVTMNVGLWYHKWYRAGV